MILLGTWRSLLNLSKPSYRSIGTMIIESLAREIGTSTSCQSAERVISYHSCNVFCAITICLNGHLSHVTKYIYNSPSLKSALPSHNGIIRPHMLSRPPGLLRQRRQPRLRLTTLPPTHRPRLNLPLPTLQISQQFLRRLGRQILEEFIVHSQHGRIDTGA